MATFSQEILDRFWSKVNKNGPTMSHMDTPCWVWTAGVNGNGYGTFERETAHRISYTITKGPLGRLYALHDCDNRLCVNPDHLHCGTHLDNMREASDRGAFSARRGSAACNVKLTENDVREIRRLRATGYSGVEVAKLYEVSPSTICAIVTRQNWAHVP